VQDEYTICMLLHNKTCYQHLMKRHKKGILCPNKKHIIHHTHTDTKLSITILRLIDCFIVFNATFSNISAISWSWRPVLVVEEARVPVENHRPWASNWKTLSLAIASRVHFFL
jgi:hypothetical protein